MASTFTASGIASGLDTNSIISQLVTIESQPITALRNKQSALKTQISLLGNIASKLGALSDAAKALGTGALAVKATSGNTAFSAVASSAAGPGSYSIEVSSLAVAAKARSQAYAPTDTVAPGVLNLNVRGTTTAITVDGNQTLADVASLINASGAAVTASVITANGSQYLSVTNKLSGLPDGVPPAEGLSFGFVPAGGVGTELSFSSLATATNAALKVDGLDVASQTNDITGVIPGVTVSLKALTSAPETLTFAADSAATATNLKAFVDAYNGVASLLQQQLAVSASTNRSTSLAGDSSVRSLQRGLQSLLSTQVPGAGSLSELGLTTSRTGELTLDQTVLAKKMASDPNAVNAIFGQATTGLGAVTQALAKTYNDPISGILTGRQTGLNGQIKALDDQAVRLQLRVDSYRQTLVAQFTAMEKMVSALKSSSTYLTNLGNASSGSSK